MAAPPAPPLWRASGGREPVRRAGFTGDFEHPTREESRAVHGFSQVGAECGVRNAGSARRAENHFLPLIGLNGLERACIGLNGREGQGRWGFIFQTTVSRG